MVTNVEGQDIEFSTQHEHENSDQAQASQSSRRTWKCFKEKVPAYIWDNSAGGVTFPLKPDILPSNLEEGGQSWCFVLADGKRDRIKLDVPLNLWGEVGNWWSIPSWSNRQPGLLRGVT